MLRLSMNRGLRLGPEGLGPRPTTIMLEVLGLTWLVDNRRALFVKIPLYDDKVYTVAIDPT